jgi:SAM-dependent methyltransferase
MVRPAAPQIFSPVRRLAARRRMLALQARSGAARYVIDDMIEDVIERLAFLRIKPRRALVIGDWTGDLARQLGAEQREPCAGFDEEKPYPEHGYDFIASIAALDTLNDLPGALIHMRAALAPGGFAIASFLGAGSLPTLRSAMLVADGDRPAPRLHPMVDVRAGGQLLQRAGWADPVVDSRSLEVRYSSLDRLVSDLRAQGMGNVLARPGPPLTRAAIQIACSTFGNQTAEHFEILTLSGWRR